MTETPWGDDGVDDSSENDDVCHHRVPFDEDCEFCELEDEDAEAQPDASR